jgi:hypothetical protein
MSVTEKTLIKIILVRFSSVYEVKGLITVGLGHATHVQLPWCCGRTKVKIKTKTGLYIEWPRSAL